jgi:diguanylate cyclase (GGDEF)-like protein/PAS domain S-box-containing protein
LREFLCLKVFKGIFMNLQSQFVYLIFYLFCFFSLVFLFYIWRQRSAQGAKAFFFLIVSSSFYPITWFFELISRNLQYKLAWNALQLLCTALFTSIGLIFVLLYTGQRQYLSRRLLMVLSAIPLIEQIIIWADQNHQLYRVNPYILARGPFSELVFDFGPLLWVFQAFYLFLILISIYILSRSVKKFPRVFRSQILMIISAFSFPVVINIITSLVGIVKLGELAPVAFGLSNLVFFIVLTVFNLFDVVPIVYHRLFNQLQDGIIIIDGNMKVVAVNQAANNIFIDGEENLIGKDSRQVLGFFGQNLEKYLGKLSQNQHLELEVGIKNKVFQLSASTFDTRGLSARGIQLIFHDITEQKIHEKNLQESEARYRTIFKATGTAMVLIDADMVIRLCNSEFERLSGYGKNHIEGKMKWTEFVSQDDLARMRDYHKLRRMPDSKAPQNYIFRFLPKSGQTYQVYVTVSVIPGTQESLASLIDITEQKAVEEKDRQIREMTEALQQIANIFTTSLDVDQIMDEVLDQVIRFFPYDAANIMMIEGDYAVPTKLRGYDQYGEDFTGRIPEIRFHKENVSNIKWICENKKPLVVPDTYACPGWVIKNTSVQVRSWLGVPIIAQDQVIGILGLDKHESGFYNNEHAERLSLFVSQASIAIEKALLFAELQRLAVVDTLTGYFNRRYFYEQTELEFERSRRYLHPISMIMFDLDHFKNVNDKFGHLVGDEVLIHVTRICRQELREVDLTGRYGGEEFLILLPETRIEKARQVAERLRKSVMENPFIFNQRPIKVTISLGVASIEQIDEADRVETLIHQADLALYLAKADGRNAVHIWKESFFKPNITMNG